MKTRNLKQVFCSIICIVLIAAMALLTAGCAEKAYGENSVPQSVAEGASQIGEGATKFNFAVIGADGRQAEFIISTDKETVGEALLQVELIKEEMGDYGLFVKTVNGETHDANTDRMYWAFYIDGEYANSGVSTTEIEAGKTYAFKAEKIL